MRLKPTRPISRLVEPPTTLSRASEIAPPSTVSGSFCVETSSRRAQNRPESRFRISARHCLAIAQIRVRLSLLLQFPLQSSRRRKQVYSGNAAKGDAETKRKNLAAPPFKNVNKLRPEQRKAERRGNGNHDHLVLWQSTHIR